MTSGETELRPDMPITTRTLHRERVKISQHVAAAIAHELRNPVFGITSAAQLLRYRNNDDPIIERNLGRILRDTERLNVLIAALLEFGRPEPVQLVAGDPDDVWKLVLDAHRGLLESKALLVQHTPASPRANCAIDREQFGQALSNLLVNAIDASPEGRDLAITSTVARDGTWQSRLQNEGAPPSADVLARLFEPLVTTKPGHAGIGLAVAHRIVGEHVGALSLETADGSTTVIVTLPPGSIRLP
ncbi:MAG TPA: ATP-binding protein [Gemmatimonadaceae bacterium]|jgi:signal transduction histidine kinase